MEEETLALEDLDEILDTIDDIMDDIEIGSENNGEQWFKCLFSKTRS